MLDSLSPRDRHILTPDLRPLTLDRGDVLLEPGEDVVQIYFPGPGTIAALVLHLHDGKSAEAAMIGMEGAIGGIISNGDKPAFAHGVAEIAGPALRLSTDALEDAKQRSPSLRDHFARYADCLLAQVLQSVACNAVHDFDARLARWLLATQDRCGKNNLKVTQDFIADMLGVRRPYATRIAGQLEQTGSIHRGRGTITIVDRARLERQACECYGYLRNHFERLLPGVYPAYAD
ncbi:MAG TPA: Crp/Fnr family transcriptional regulator [Rhizomicrobium sp.]|nr:Crp/Fnr family transcriptional regulator [Rhizomicrobium sp.]